jgi:hypothetical protein
MVVESVAVLFVSAALAGTTVVTAGADVFTENVDVKSAASGLPATSFTPVAPLFTVTVYCTPLVSAADGVNVATCVRARRHGGDGVAPARSAQSTS